jgi:hypothetical protein
LDGTCTGDINIQTGCGIDNPLSLSVASRCNSLSYATSLANGSANATIVLLRVVGASYYVIHSFQPPGYMTLKVKGTEETK